jgi:asparagine N-glycosylation enzyme membrane subunit Stt3
MNKFWKFLQYGYLIIAVIFLIEAIIAWKNDINKALFMLGFSIFILLIFFFKRKFRKKIERKNKL